MSISTVRSIVDEAAVKRSYYETHEQLRSHLADVVTAYNFARHLKTLKGLNTLRIHLFGMVKTTRTLQKRFNPSNPVTKHLELEVPYQSKL